MSLLDELVSFAVLESRLKFREELLGSSTVLQEDKIVSIMKDRK